jgi:hypothetical protein
MNAILFTPDAVKAFPEFPIEIDPVPDAVADLPCAKLLAPLAVLEKPAITAAPAPDCTKLPHPPNIAEHDILQTMLHWPPTTELNPKA